MKRFDRLMATSCLGLGLLAGGSGFATAADWGFRHRDPNNDLREVVDRTQSDLRTAADLEIKHGDDHNRYKNAQGHLSTFDRKLVKGKFDKGELEKALDDIKDILDHNVLQASTRDSLMRDMTDLKVARDRRE
ncbi:MAG: hypothetical protein ACJ746_14290 [Bryobacteraceae bacterium]